MGRNQKKQAFTLVELIVVITILAILGTIAFISLQGYSAQARDSKRLSDISNIKKSVELFSLNTGKYPEPDDSLTVSYSGEILWYQGTVGDQVSTNVSRNLQEKPVDPSTGIEYTYSTTHSQTEYEVLGLYESDILSTSPQPSPLGGEGARPKLFFSSNAAILDYPKIDGNYNGIYIKTSSFYVPTPSIINAEILSDTDVKDTTLLKSQIVTGGDNLPGVSTGGLNINLTVYEGTITENSTEGQKITLVEAIQNAYSGSDLASDTMYADILSRTSTGELVDFVDVVVLGRTEYSSTSSDISNTTNAENHSFAFIDLGDWIQENDGLGIILDEEKLVLSGDYQSTPSNMVNPATVTLLGAQNHLNQTGGGLIDGTQVNEWDTNNVFYWHKSYVYTTYISYNIAENFRIWRSGTATWINLINKLKIEKLEGENRVEVIDKHLSMTFINYTTWARFTEELEAGTYRFYLYDATLARLDSEWFFEKTGDGYLIDQPYYITTSDTNQLDLSTISTISSVDITNNQPTGTSIKALVSFDGRITWKKWNGSAWVDGGTLGDLQSGNTITEIEEGLTNLSITSESSLDFAFDLSTTDELVTPEISGISVSYE